VRAAPEVKRRRVTKAEVRAILAAFEAAQPGYGAHNYADAFRDENGKLVESAEFFEIAAWCAVLDAPDHP
jgi:hypothetical protein